MTNHYKHPIYNLRGLAARVKDAFQAKTDSQDGESRLRKSTRTAQQARVDDGIDTLGQEQAGARATQRNWQDLPA